MILGMFDSSRVPRVEMDMMNAKSTYKVSIDRVNNLSVSKGSL